MIKRLFALLMVLLIIAMFLVLLHPNAHAEGLVLYAAHKSGELNIRDGPDGHRIGYLEPGDAVEYLRQKGDWIQVKVGVEAGLGWVKAAYLTMDLGAAGTYRNTSGGRVRIRKSPGGKAVKWLDANATVEVLSVMPDHDDNLWGRTKSGYVQLCYLEATP